MVFEHMLYCAEVNAVADDVDALRTTTVQGVCSGLNNKKKDWDRNA
jgi:copper homeostasis protein CutC